MSKQQADRSPGSVDRHDDIAHVSSRRRRVTAGGMVGGAVIFAVLYVVDRLRPSRRRERHGTGVEPVPAAKARLAENRSSSAGYQPAPPGVHAPVSSPWPLVVAGATAFAAFGLITNYAFTMVGVVLLIVGIVGWVGELIRE